MSCGHLRIVSTLLGVAVCAPIAALPALSQPRAIVSSTVSSLLSSALTSVPNSAAVNVPDVAPEAAIDPETGKFMSCRSTDPVFCIYANRNLVSHLQQEVWATVPSTEPQQVLSESEEMANSSHRLASSAALGRKIRFLTQLKIWLDAVS